MSKAKEFAALAEAATPGKWEAGLPQSERSGYTEVTHIRLGNGDHTGYVACRDADFMVWCANNRDFLIRAAKTQEALEYPSVEMVNAIRGHEAIQPKEYAAVRPILSAFLEEVNK